MLACVVAAWVGLMAPGDASAQQVRRQFKDKIHVLQPKPVLSKGRFDISPHMGFSFNDPLYQSVRVGVNANYHISERLYVGALFDWYNFGNALGGITESYQATIDATSSTPDAPALNFAGGLEVGLVPIFGKFSLFNSGIVYYDAAVTLGAMYVDRRSIQLPSISDGLPLGGTVSVVMHIFLSEWLSLNFEVRDTLFSVPLQGAAEASLSHIATATVGVGFYLPTQVSRSADPNEPED